ncbi:hypothetical protein GOV14_03020 [Candidatus Pacearchaeota archaeon]|nr:hypothetical protein [Candidatus Pacearchaeota archaeon]
MAQILTNLGIAIFIYILGFLITPNHVFYTRIKKTKRLERIAKKFRSGNKEKTLRNVYSHVINNFSNEKYNFILQSYKLFFTDVEKLLQKKQFAQCTLQNLVLITLLINTGQFKKEDFKRKWRIIHGIILHQYILVKIKNKVFRVDPLLRKIS